MWPLNRKKSDQDVPANVNNYYQESGNKRKGVALIVGVIGLIVALLLATLIYFGGRWVYRHSMGKSKSKSKSTPTATEPTSIDTGAASTQPTATPVSNTGASTAPASSTPATTPATGPGTSNPTVLVNTGPTSEE